VALWKRSSSNHGICMFWIGAMRWKRRDYDLQTRKLPSTSTGFSHLL
jgi:hypothetical protein